jgi:hypothetical protein
MRFQFLFVVSCIDCTAILSTGLIGRWSESWSRSRSTSLLTILSTRPTVTRHRSMVVCRDQFRRFLAERSLALQFDQFNPGKLESMIENRPFDLPKGRHASSRSFARHLSIQHVEVVLQAVHVGLRYLLLERTCGSAISWVLGFFRKEVRCMKFSTVQEAVSCYEGFEELDEGSRRWMQEVLELYDFQRQRTPQTQDGIEQARKRQKTSKDSKFNQSGNLYVSNHTASNYVRMRDCRFVHFGA